MARAAPPSAATPALPPDLAARLRRAAHAAGVPPESLLRDLLTAALDAHGRERDAFLDLVTRLRAAPDPAERYSLRAALARRVFGA